MPPIGSIRYAAIPITVTSSAMLIRPSKAYRAATAAVSTTMAPVASRLIATTTAVEPVARTVAVSDTRLAVR